eukprot:gnl/Chilomastix_cuspidata/1471.p1 GENE.gnl/Chilomastix_cuspidata/1471~~gnl/Chilomastix_cuspidata/1471.p1  ORF type:complete len:809 (+),score=330.17 gnl/Chilomastix_cuspidata/1471:31-2457(+)
MILFLLFAALGLAVRKDVPDSGNSDFVRAFNAALQDVCSSSEWTALYSKYVSKLDFPEFEECTDDCITARQNWPKMDDTPFKGTLYNILKQKTLKIGYLRDSYTPGLFSGDSSTAFERDLLDLVFERISTYYDIDTIKPEYIPYPEDENDDGDITTFEDELLTGLREGKYHMVASGLRITSSRRNSGMFGCSYLGSDIGIMFKDFTPACEALPPAQMNSLCQTVVGNLGSGTIMIPAGTTVESIISNFNSISEAQGSPLKIFSFTDSPMNDYVSSKSSYTLDVSANSIVEAYDSFVVSSDSYMFGGYFTELSAHYMNHESNTIQALYHGFVGTEVTGRYSFMFRFDDAGYSQGNKEMRNAFSAAMKEWSLSAPNGPATVYYNVPEGYSTTHQWVIDYPDLFVTGECAVGGFPSSVTDAARRNACREAGRSYCVLTVENAQMEAWLTAFYSELYATDAYGLCGPEEVIPVLARPAPAKSMLWAAEYPDYAEATPGGTFDRALSSGSIRTIIGAETEFLNSDSPPGLINLFLDGIIEKMGFHYGRKTFAVNLQDKFTPEQRVTIGVSGEGISKKEADDGVLPDSDMAFSLLTVTQERQLYVEFGMEIMQSLGIVAFVPPTESGSCPTSITSSSFSCVKSSAPTETLKDLGGTCSADFDSFADAFRYLRGVSNLGVYYDDTYVFSSVFSCALYEIELGYNLNCPMICTDLSFDTQPYTLSVPFRYDWDDSSSSTSIDFTARILGFIAFGMAVLGTGIACALFVMHMFGKDEPREREEEMISSSFRSPGNQMPKISAMRAASPLQASALPLH